MLAFISPVTLLTITPAGDTLPVIHNTNRGGWQDGAASSLGICAGLFVHALVSSGGIFVVPVAISPGLYLSATSV